MPRFSGAEAVKEVDAWLAGRRRPEEEQLADSW